MKIKNAVMQIFIDFESDYSHKIYILDYLEKLNRMLDE